MENLNFIKSYYWCFNCNEECKIYTNEDDPICEKCDSSFVEEMDKDQNNLDNPKNFVPQRNETNTTNLNTVNNISQVLNPNNRTFFFQVSLNQNGQVQVISNQGTNSLQQWMQQFNNIFNNNSLINLNTLNYTSDFFPNLFNRPNNDQTFENLLNYLMMNDPNRYGNPPASKKTIEELERIKITDNNITKFKDFNCSLCMEDCIESEILIKMKCSHFYHEKCILEWLKITNTCPICRDELLTDDLEYENRKNERRRMLRSYPNSNQNQNTTNSRNPNSHNMNYPHRHGR